MDLGFLSPTPPRPGDFAVGPRPPSPATSKLSELGGLLEELERAGSTASAPPPPPNVQSENQLVQVRLGVAAGLYAALRCKHAPTASHGLRVALTASAWAVQMGLADEQRDAVEVAALLHDLGMIGVPDQILMKPGPLDADESRVVEQSRKMGVGILRNCSADARILDAVENVGAWYDGSRGGYRVRGEAIPLEARILAIAEAFDAMSTDHVFRSAMSMERVIAELFEFAGRQFDPALVKRFAKFHAGHCPERRCEVASRWLKALDPRIANSYWQLSSLPLETSLPDERVTFEAKLLDGMHDAAIFIDDDLRVLQWNYGAERLTGIAGASVIGRNWSSRLLGMKSEQGRGVDEKDCPVITTIQSGVQSLRRLTVQGRNGKPVVVDGHTISVTSNDGATMGAILLLHDASSETTLEQRCQSLHEKSTKDPMTQVANRAEFDRVLELFVNTHRRQQVPCSLIICDLDHFKKVNDTWGHPAGDDAIRSLAKILKRNCRGGDLVARYGGEEFVMLCADCDNTTAARRAEQIRKLLAKSPQPQLDGRPITASFGVTEIQPGDTPAAMLRRADRGLLMAKSKGRNTVVQLGSGPDAPRQVRPGDGRPTSHGGAPLIRDLLTPMPMSVAIEKLSGFVADHQAKILSIKGRVARLEIDSLARHPKRKDDRSMPFAVELRFSEEPVPAATRPRAGDGRATRTRIHVTIGPRGSRERREEDVHQRAVEVLTSVRSYLMATDSEPTPRKGLFARIRAFPWRRR